MSNTPIRSWLNEVTELASQEKHKTIQILIQGERAKLFISATPKPGNHKEEMPKEQALKIAQDLMSISFDYPDKLIAERKLWHFEIQKGVVSDCGYHVILNKVHDSMMIITITATLTTKEVEDVHDEIDSRPSTFQELAEMGESILKSENNG